MKIIRKVSKRIHIHNDLSNAAFHIKENIARNRSIEGYEGISLEIMSCLIMLAFSNEAKINFIGHKIIPKWKERDSFYDKLKTICNELDVELDLDAGPYKTLSKLHDLRSTFAHGKPIIIDYEDEVAPDQHDFDSLMDLKADWEVNVSYDFLMTCFDDSKYIWEEWLALAGIDRDEIITSGHVSAEIVDY